MLPQFGFTEFLLIAIIALIVVGPKDLPLMMRKLGQLVGRARSLAREFQSAFDDIARQAELDELRKEINDLKSQSQSAVQDAEEDMRAFETDVNTKMMEMEKQAEGTAKEPGE
ncbi:MAG: Sec-independent protein translocase protein TatB [Pseudomonadota bacterium]